MHKRTIVLGIGNVLNTDEGVGVHAVGQLQQRLGTQGDLEFLDGGTLGMNLLPLVEESSHLLLLDAANAGRPPGSLVCLDRDEIPLFTGIKMSEHQITFQEVLGLAKVRGNLPPHLRLVGVQPADLSIGYGMSETILRVLPSVLQEAERVLRVWGLLAATEGAARCASAFPEK